MEEKLKNKEPYPVNGDVTFLDKGKFVSCKYEPAEKLACNVITCKIT